MPLRFSREPDLSQFAVPSPRALSRLQHVALILTSGRKRGRMVLTALAVITIVVGAEFTSASSAMAGPPYQNCNEARADGRSSIPSTDPAYRPELDLDGDGLACEPAKSRRSTR